MATAPGATAWDRREDESAARYARFMEYLHTPPSQRAALLSKRGRDRDWANFYSWRARAVAYDDQADIAYEQARLELAREARKYHAQAGRALLNFAIGRITNVQIWSPGNLIKLADLARKMEVAAVLGAEREFEPASRAAMAMTGGGLDEWDRIAAELNAGPGMP